MPAFYPHVSTAETRPMLPFALQDVKLLQGKRSAALQDAIGDVYVYWMRLRPYGDESEPEQWYVPMPAKRSVSIFVRMRIRGRGRPMPYDIDDELGE